MQIFYIIFIYVIYMIRKKNYDDEKENLYLEKQINEFKSHYLQHFETIHHLGKGIFAIVFEARNKLGDGKKICYKRIHFPLCCMDTSSNITDTTSDFHIERKRTVPYLFIQMELYQ